MEINAQPPRMTFNQIRQKNLNRSLYLLSFVENPIYKHLNEEQLDNIIYEIENKDVSDEGEKLSAIRFIENEIKIAKYKKKMNLLSLPAH